MLTYITRAGVVRCVTGTDLTTGAIAHHRQPGDVYVVQLIGHEYLVYALTTIRAVPGGLTIGIPKFGSEDADAAIAWGVMNL